MKHIAMQSSVLLGRQLAARKMLNLKTGKRVDSGRSNPEELQGCSVFLGVDFCWPRRTCSHSDRQEGGECGQLAGRCMDHMVGALVVSLLSYSVLKHGREKAQKVCSGESQEVSRSDVGRKNASRHMAAGVKPRYSSWKTAADGASLTGVLQRARWRGTRGALFK